MKNLILFLSLILATLHGGDLAFFATDLRFEYRSAMPQGTYHQYCKNIYSQNGEDGVIAQLFKELQITKGTFCEFGAADGIRSSNTYQLIREHGFCGMAIESEYSSYLQCVKNYSAFPEVQVFHGLVLYNDPQYDLNAWLKKGGLAHDFDLLSIDIDSDDYYVWENLTDFAPKVVIFETNPYRDPIYDELPGIASQEYNIDPLKQWHPSRVAIGCSFISAIKLGLKKGYVPVAYTGNLTFVRKDLIHQLKQFPYLLSEDPYDYIGLYTHLVLWQNQWYTNTGLILNAAIRDYYLEFHKKEIDPSWLNKRMHQILHGNSRVI
jgi:hypothetical protein